MSTKKKDRHDRITSFDKVDNTSLLLYEKIASQSRLISKLKSELQKSTTNLNKTNKQIDFYHSRSKTNLSKSFKKAVQGCIRYSIYAEKAEYQKTSIGIENFENQIRSLLNFLNAHLYLLNRKLIYIYSNNRHVLSGVIKDKQLIGKRLQDIFPDRIATLFKEKTQEVYKKNNEIVFDYNIQSGASEKSYRNTLFPIIEKGHLIAIGGVCRDITEKRKMEGQIIQAQKMEAIGTMVAGVAHEVNNPINLILFNLPLFKKIWIDILQYIHSNELTQNEELKFGGLDYQFIDQNVVKLIDDMQFAATRVARIVASLKEFAKKGCYSEKSDVQVNHAIENAARLANATICRTKHSLKLDLSPDLPLVSANLQNIEQLVLNLLINAFQSIDHDHGLVTVRSSKKTDGKLILIEVEDNGRGINPSVVQRLYDPFVTDRQQIGGTGLGLSVSYSIVKAHQGEMYFKSKPDQGTVFKVVLPINTIRRVKKIMVVDDDRAFRLMLTKTLAKKTDSHVEGIANGVEALIRLGSNPPDLLILDMFMPQLDGIEVCRAIKNEIGFELTKVIIVTGFPDHPNVSEVKRMGIAKVFTKPLDKDLFIDAIRESLDGKPA